MFQGLQDNQLKGAIEAMLFVTDEPVGTIALADMLEVEPGQAERALVELRDQLEGENRGIQLREVAGGWRLYTHPAYHELIERYVLSWDTRKLSQAAMETLAIVAYLQPVTRSGVASVRGVNSDTRAFIRERLSATREDAFVADDARLDGDEADPLDGVRFELDDEGPGSIAESPREEAASDAAQQMLAEAMASGVGLVEKIDFDNLTFETDDE